MSDDLIHRIHESTIGSKHLLTTPFGAFLVTYADYTASGRSLSFIEDFIRNQVLPYYANTHSESSGCAQHTTKLRESARDTIHAAVGADADTVVIFSGAGVTGAITRLMGCMGLYVPSESGRALKGRVPPPQRPVVFVGPYEHHSNELPWRESVCDTVVIPENQNGLIDQTVLAAELAKYADRPLKIGSFSAASNVTGIISDTEAITALLKRHGALSFWDYAAAAPHLKIDMGQKDAIFISPHKFIGGPGTPGVLVVRRHLLSNTVPAVPGGGTVLWVGPNEATQYLPFEEVVAREEGGTPAIIESIRAGLVFQLKQAVGDKTIVARERAITSKALSAWGADPNIQVLGNTEVDRLPIISFRIRRPAHNGRPMFLHHTFATVLLNDMFGIQARDGCSCAGPYGFSLLQLQDLDLSSFQAAMGAGETSVKPGWIRISFKYSMPEYMVDFLIRAVSLVAQLGWAAMPMYRFTVDGKWKHRSTLAVNSSLLFGPNSGALGLPPLTPLPSLNLDDLSYDSAGILRYPVRSGAMSTEATAEYEFARYLSSAEAILTQLAQNASPQAFGENSSLNSKEFEAIRWFQLPAVCLSNECSSFCSSVVTEGGNSSKTQVPGLSPSDSSVGGETCGPCTPAMEWNLSPETPPASTTDLPVTPGTKPPDAGSRFLFPSPQIALLPVLSPPLSPQTLAPSSPEPSTIAGAAWDRSAIKNPPKLQRNPGFKVPKRPSGTSALSSSPSQNKGKGWAAFLGSLRPNRRRPALST